MLPLTLMGILGLVTLVASVVMVGVLWLDKRLAQGGGRRIPERTLHTIELCGGWAGSLLGRRWFRHKTRKGTYRLTAGIITGLHVVVWLLLAVWALP